MNLRIKKARETAGLSQKVVAITLGVSAPTVSEWESGKKKPSTENLKELADLFGVSADYLLSGSENDIAYVCPSTKKLRSPFPVSILAAQYNLSSDVLASIAAVPRDVATAWIVATENPSEDEFSTLADFFEIELSDLKKGVVPLSPLETVSKKVSDLTSIRFAAYDKRGNFTPEELDKINDFIDWVISHRSKDEQP